MAARYARVERKAAPLSCDFARDFITRRFSARIAEALYENMPRYQRGKRKGEIKGWLHWKKCTSGGWLKAGPGYMNGGVCRPGSFDLCVTLSRDGEPGDGWLDENANATEEMRIDFIKRRGAEL